MNYQNTKLLAFLHGIASITVFSCVTGFRTTSLTTFTQQSEFNIRRPFGVSQGLRSRNHFSQVSMTSDSDQSSGNILVVGSANQDLVSYTPRLPKPGETVLGHGFETQCGGKGANQAVAAGLLGIANEVRMLCMVGKDSFGEALLAQFDKSGVAYDKDSIYSPKGTVTGNAAICVDDAGENCIVVTAGANGDVTPEFVSQQMKALSPKPNIVIVQLEISQPSALEALKVGQELGAMTIFNPAPAPSSGDLDDDFYKYSDVVIPNETELKELTDHDFKGDEDTEEARAKHLLQKGVGKAVIVTLGARGAMVVPKDGSEPTIVSAPKDLPANELPVKDTVGAGDSFCGSLSAYFTAGMSLQEAAGYACGVASMSVRKKGAQTSYPSYEELPDSLKLKEKVAA